MELPEDMKTAEAASRVLDSQQGTDFVVLPIGFDILPGLNLCNGITVFSQNLIEDVDLFQGGQERIVAAIEIDKGCETLEHIIALLKFGQVNMKGIMTEIARRATLVELSQLI